MTVRGWAFGIAAAGTLAACDGSSGPRPLTLPMADGRAQEIVVGDGYRYVVNQQALEQAYGKVFLRVTRATAPELDYSDGLTARKVADAYCAGYNRKLNPGAYGKFSTPASWLFEGGCI